MTDLTNEALEGYRAIDGAKCPDYETSASGMAWAVGRMMNRLGWPAPHHVRPGRGYQIHASGLLFAFDREFKPYLPDGHLRTASGVLK